MDLLKTLFLRLAALHDSFPNIPLPCWRGAVLLLIFFFVAAIPAHTLIAQTSRSFDITLEEMGYDEQILQGPLSTTRYYFSLPPNWEPQVGSHLTLHLDYVIGIREEYPPAFLRVELNGTLLHTEMLTSPTALQVQVDIPPDAFSLPEDQYVNTLRLEFEVDEECEMAILDSLAVRNSSLLHLVYQEKPLQLDLALYPRPIYQQQAFEPGQVRFVLPAEPTDSELRAATMIAARLGQLSAARLPISATLSTSLLPDSVSQEHLIIIGRPDDQPLIHQLDLPVPLAERRLALSSEMPAVVAPGETLSYTLSVENTSADTQSLAVEDRLPLGGTLLTCSGSCAEIEPGTVRWEIGPLAPGQRVSTTIEIQLDLPTAQEAGTPEVSGGRVEHTASLLDAQGSVLNVDTLSAQAGAATSKERIVSHDASSPGGIEGQDSHFFIHDNQGVAEGDGLIQEIVSPWSSNHAAILVTGLDEEGLLLAAQALSSDNRFPGMWGDYAMVQAMRPVTESIATPFENLSLASLGYNNTTIGAYLDNLDFRFYVPPGWKLGDDSYLALHLAHGAALSDTQATLEVQLNNVSVGSVHLDESNTYDSWAIIPLPAAASQTSLNRIRVQVSADLEERCRYLTNDQYWLTVFADSFLHLPQQSSGLILGLENLPYPFSNHPGLEDIVFLLPDPPAQTEVEGMLRLAAQLGGAAGGNGFSPQVAQGGQPEATPWTEHHLIAVGLPTNNPYLAVANNQLPQTFRPGTNEILQHVDQAIYRLPPDLSLGYVQELLSPWNQDRAMLAIMGTTDQGVAWALASLTDDQLQRNLSGNLALIRDGQVWSMDTRDMTPEEVAIMTQEVEPTSTLVVTSTSTPTPTPTPTPSPLPTATPTVPPTLTPTPEANTILEPAPPTTSSGQPSWLLPLVLLTAAIVIIALGIGVWRARKV